MLSIEGVIVNIDGQRRGRVEINQTTGLIAKVGEPSGQADIVLGDELIFPGFVDLHVHARECVSHAWDYKEDFATAGAAAINGGVVAFADMPNNPIPPVDGKSYAEKLAMAKKCPVDVLLYAGIGLSTHPFSDEVAQFIEPDKPDESGNYHNMAVPYKIFMGKSVGDLFFKSFGELETSIAGYRGQSISFHCEDPEILEANRHQPTHALRRPPEAEVSAINFAIKMTEKYNLYGKICHLSTEEGLRKIIEAKKKGVSVTCEVAPHHLYYDSSVRLQINPPLRAKEDCLALLSALRDGRIDFLATDHAPHTIEEREKGVSGLPHLDTYGPFAAWLMAERGLTPQDIARACSYNPGWFMNKFSDFKYGRIEKGFAGSLTVIDLNRPVKIEKSMLKTKCAWSPFEGVTFPGRVVYTVVKGKLYKM